MNSEYSKSLILASEWIERGRALIMAVELTEDERQAAIFEAKRKKYFHLRNLERWSEQQKEKPKPTQP